MATTVTTWTDCPHCRAEQSVAPPIVRPAMTYNGRRVSDPELVSECLDCDQIVHLGPAR